MRERIAGLLILLVLVSIAAAMVLRQLRWMEQAQQGAALEVPASEPAPAPVEPAPPAPASGLGAWVSGWAATGSAEHYDADRLFEKVNGHAPLYLDAGFEDLEVQRFEDPEDTTRSLELRLWTMASPEAAAHVRAETARPGGEPPAPELDGQCLEGACFVALGSHYLEVLASPPAAEMTEACRGVVQAFVEDAARNPLDPIH